MGWIEVWGVGDVVIAVTALVRSRMAARRISYEVGPGMMVFSRYHATVSLMRELLVLVAWTR